MATIEIVDVYDTIYYTSMEVVIKVDGEEIKLGCPDREYTREHNKDIAMYVSGLSTAFMNRGEGLSDDEEEELETLTEKQAETWLGERAEYEREMEWDYYSEELSQFSLDDFKKYVEDIRVKTREEIEVAEMALLDVIVDELKTEHTTASNKDYLFCRAGHAADDCRYPLREEVLWKMNDDRQEDNPLKYWITVCIVRRDTYLGYEPLEVRICSYVTNTLCGDGEGQDQGKKVETVEEARVAIRKAQEYFTRM